jgi:hypothetical protein
MAEKKVIEIDIETNVSSLKSELRQAQAEVASLSEKFGATSREAAEAAKRAAELKDRIGDAKALTDAFNPDAKFNALSSSIGGVLNGFQAYEGALGLIGVESEQVQATLLKVQSAMALSQGIQGLAEAKDSFVQLGAVVKNTTLFTSLYNFVMGISNKETATNVLITEADSTAKVGLTAATGSLTTVTGGATLAMRALRVALIATGIGAIVVLVGLLIANFDKVTAVVQKLSGYVIKAYDYFDNLGTSIKILIGIFFPMIGVIYGAIKALEYFNIIDTKNERDMSARHVANMKRIDKELEKREKQKEARKKAYDEEDKALGRQIALLEAQGKSSDALVEKRLKNSISYQKSLLEELQLNERILKATNAMGVNDELLKETQTAITDTKNAILDAENQLDINKAEIDKKRRENAKKQSESLYEINDEEMKRREGQRKMDDENLKEYLSVGLDAQKGFEDAFKDVKKTSALESIQLLSDTRTKELEIEKATADKKVEIEKIMNEQKAVIQQQGLDIALQGVGIIKDVFEKSKGVQKAAVIAESAIGIAKMIIANKLANIGALATPQAIATSGASAAPVIAANNISTGLGIAANIAATAKALQALGGGSAPSGGGVGGGGGGTGSTFTPSFNVVGNSGINQLASLQQQPVKAYITAGEVSTALSLERNTLQKTTF